MNSVSRELVDLITKNNINVITSNSGSRNNNCIIVHLLNELAIFQKKVVHMYNVKEDRSYYLGKLISFISGLDFYLVQNYTSLCDMDWIDGTKDLLNPTAREKYLDTVDEIIISKLVIANLDKKEQRGEDYIDYILKDKTDDIIRSEFIIIDSFDYILANSKYSLINILEKFKAYSKKYNTKFILFTNFTDLSVQFY